MARALITGGAGFIGFHLAKSFVGRGHETVLLDDFSRGVSDRDFQALCESPRVSAIRCDLREPGSLDDLGSGFQYVCHLAAMVGVPHVLQRPYDVLHDNVLTSLRVVDFARRQRSLKRLVFASSSEVYAGALKHFELRFPTPEDAPLALTGVEHPRTSYMLSKLYGEALCRHAGVPFTIVRLHNVYGPRMGLVHVVPRLLQQAHRAPEHGRLEVSSVDHRRTFCYVDDAVEWMVRATECADGAGQTLNVGCPAPEISIGELACKVARVVNKDLQIAACPEMPGSPVRRCPDTRRLIGLTGYEACVGLDEGIARTYQWYRERVFDGCGPSAE
jgi:nucleoside-diphosphate-sugar epimerase